MFDPERPPSRTLSPTGAGSHETATHRAATTPNFDKSAGTAGAIADDDTGVVETGTTVVGVTTDDAAVLAADRRASLAGRFVTSKAVRKVEQVHPTAAVALSGGVGHIQRFVRTVETEATLYEDRRGRPMSMRALSTFVGSLLGTTPLRVTPVLAGVDQAGPHLYGIDEAGGVLADDYAASGSGTQLAYGVLERRYDSEASVAGARKTAASAVATAAERDTASGNGLTVATITENGVELATGDGVAEVAA